MQNKKIMGILWQFCSQELTILLDPESDECSPQAYKFFLYE